MTRRRTQLLHNSGISKAGRGIAQWIGGGCETRAASRLIGNTDNLESIAGDGIDEIGAIYMERINGKSDLGEERKQRDLRSIEFCQ